MGLIIAPPQTFDTWLTFFALLAAGLGGIGYILWLFREKIVLPTYRFIRYDFIPVVQWFQREIPNGEETQESKDISTRQLVWRTKTEMSELRENLALLTNTVSTLVKNVAEHSENMTKFLGEKSVSDEGRT